MRRRLVPALSVLALTAAVSVPVTQTVVSAAALAAADRAAVLVQLDGDPLTVSPATRPARGKRIDLASSGARAERARLAAVRREFRDWLRANAPRSRITSEHDLAVHAVGVELHGLSLDALRAAPFVVHVEQQQVFEPADANDPDLSLVRAQAAWSAVGGAANAGAGVKVAVIDSGIDVTHPCFDDAGYPAQQQTGDPDLTNNKVVVAKVFSNRIKQDSLDASAVDSHGTHVAGTVACNVDTPAVIDGVDIPYDVSGVAPRALLGNYNVFPADTGSARSEDILEAMEAAYADGFDVANMSLGGARNDGGGAFLLDNAVDNLDRANMVVAIAAGNEGPGYWTVHYPGAAPRALTAGASTVGHSLVNLVTVAGTDYQAVVGDFGTLDDDLTAPLKVVADPGSAFAHKLALACDGGPALPSLTGTIALLGRGTCDFTVKMRNAQNAGALGVIMVDRVEEAPFLMSHNGLEPQPTIPGYMVSLSDGATIDDHDGTPVTMRALGVYLTTPDDTNVMANFSSQGPTHGDLLVKPDVVAPGADVVSAFPASHCDEPPCWSFLGGTSMATPHLAGAAAVVRGAHPSWSAAEVRSAVVNTAQQGLLKHPETRAVTDDALIAGAGLLDVLAAVGAAAALDPVSTSFGALASGAGMRRGASVTITNVSGTARTFTVAVSDTAADGASFTGGGTFTLAAGESQTFGVAVTTAKGVADGFKQAWLRVSTGGVEVAHAALFASVGEGERAPGQHQLPPPKA